MRKDNYRATKIGAVFTVVCIALTFTYLVPVFVLLPAATFYEGLAKAIAPQSHVGKVSMQLLAGTFAMCMLPMLYSAWRTARKGCVMGKGEIIGYMLLLCFIVHPLGFYAYWGFKLNYRMDGQIIFASVDSFPISSLFFVVFGFVLDTVANYTKPNGEVQQ